MRPCFVCKPVIPIFQLNFCPMFETDDKSFLDQALPLLDQLQPDTLPLWGIMTPQHMVEHLGSIAYLSSKELNLAIATPAEFLPKSLAWLWSDKAFRKGTKAPGIAEQGLEKLRYENLDQARAKCKQAMQGFHAYFVQHPEAELIHPVFGPLNYAGWLRFHHKHILHHFTQFRLLEPAGAYLD